MSSLLDRDPQAERPSAPALAELARAVTAAVAAQNAAEALNGLTGAARAVAGADVALLRAPDETCERLEAVAVAAPRTLAAELGGTVLAASELPASTVTELGRAPEPVRRAADRAGARELLLVPVRADEIVLSLELFRGDRPFDDDERLAAELAAAQAALVLRAFAVSPGDAVASLARPALELAGEALAAALHEQDSAAEVARLAASVAGARVGILWETRESGLAIGGAYGVDEETALEAARELAERTLAEPGELRALPAEQLPEGCGISTTLPLGRPPVGVLQLLHPVGQGPDAEQLARLATFGVRAAHALRAGARARSLALELERTRAVLSRIA